MRSPVTRQISVLAAPGAQVLDVTGPHEVFARSERWLREHRGLRAPPYRVELLAGRRGPLAMSSGLRLHADRSWRSAGPEIDTLIVAGGQGVEAALADRPLLAWLRRAAATTRRLAAVCTGAFMLAEAGLLDGRKATTHWSACAALARRYPRVEVLPEPIFVRDGAISTSAGVTAGMDLALALVEEDWGAAVALAVARELVLFLRRPGNQAQFSVQLDAQTAAQPPLRRVQHHISERPDGDLSVAALARRAGLSERTFARHFAHQLGQTPARYVERARVEAACRALVEGDATLDAVARRCGFASAEVMRRSFQRTLGVPPAAYRRRFTTTHRSEESP